MVTGEGIDSLREAIASRLPRREVEIEVLVHHHCRYLVSRVHDDGAVLTESHTRDGTRPQALVSAALVADLRPCAIA